MRSPWFPPAFDLALHRVPAAHPDAVIAALADLQHGMVQALQLLALGITRAQIRSRRQSGHLKTVARGVYLVGRVTPGAKARRMAGVLAAGDEARLADLSAAVQLGARMVSPAKVHVIVPPGFRVERPDLIVRRAVVHAHESTIVDGIPCLTMARTLLDVAAHRPRRIVEDLWHDAVYRKLLDDRAVRRVLADHRAEPGTPLLHELLDRRERAIGDVANRLEAEMRELIAEAGMPEPVANRLMQIDGVGLKPDLYVAQRRLAFETDGRDGHEDPEQQVSDARKDRLYRSVGITPCRFGWWAVHYQRPGVLADLVRFETAWQRTGGHWTANDPMPRLEFSRRSVA
jgi:hypothetical protein